MHIHLSFAGKTPDPTLNTVKAIPGAIDRVVLLYSVSEDGIYKSTARTLEEKLGEMGYECESRIIKPFDFLNIVDVIYGVYEEYSGADNKAKFSVDITSGTNLMSAAACNTAFFMDSDVYYIMDRRIFKDRPLEELLVKIPSPKIPDAKRLGGLSLDMLRFIAEEQDQCREVCNADIARKFGMKPQAVMYHTARLVDAGIVELVDAHTPKGVIDKRRKAIRIKREGRFVLRWT
ncbi:MAG: helix-turn-helix transcriptional regulator [Candidatus Methanomethylophilaceae archaeon]|nr:helix-turn-helix transcriptional regulator [Candidatus Methanomethylophilaceae archaeon]